MYDEYFGLRETPFSIAPNPRFLFMSERHREALAHLVYGVNSDGGFILLTGEVGTGKTTISRCLLDQIPEKSNIAMILNPKLLAGELLATICDELHIKYPEDNTSIKVYIDCIFQYLLEQNALGRKTVVIIEEAQNLTPDVLEQLRLLTNLETNQRKLMQIVMLGQPELLDILAQPELRQLEQRITARYHLMPLTQKETIDYVNHRLGVAGARERDPIFTNAALKLIYKYSEGVPRKVNLMCDRALLGAYVHNEKIVDAKTVKQAAKEVAGRRSKTVKQQQRFRTDMLAWMVANLVLMVGVIILGYAVYTKPEALAALFNTKPAANTDSTKALALIDEQPVGESKYHAFQAVFKRWKTDMGPNLGPDACEQAPNFGLSCLNLKGNLRSLRSYNRPAVLSLINSKGQTVYAAVTQITDNMATIHLNGESANLLLDDLDTRWFGDYTLIWRPPPNFNGAIAPGSSGKEVTWVANLLAAVNGQPLPAQSEMTYDDRMMEQVKQFQLKMGLVSDGIVGAQTLIYLNSAAGLGVPKLGELSRSSTAEIYGIQDAELS
jgi:general secretion pathway protein A